MNKKRILSIGIPMIIRNKTGEMATIELNKSEFVVCRYHPNNSVYLSDAHLIGWHPSHALKRVIYFLMGLITDH
jgi:hypothetical protein